MLLIPTGNGNIIARWNLLIPGGMFCVAGIADNKGTLDSLICSRERNVAVTRIADNKSTFVVLVLSRKICVDRTTDDKSAFVSLVLSRISAGAGTWIAENKSACIRCNS